MDNLTHSLVGLLLAEVALAQPALLREKTSPKLRLVACIASISANNVPDLDFTYARRITEGKLGYLLHHRGHSHTLLVAIGLGALLYFAAAAWLRRGHAPSRVERRTLFALCCAGPLVHIALDYGNNYGVHPFWPLFQGWFYGDSLFIVEPWLWVALLPPLACLARTKIARAVLGSLLAMTLMLAWTLELVPWGAALALSAGALLSVFLAFRFTRGARVGQGVFGVVLVSTCFAVSSAVARSRVVAELQMPEPGEARPTVLDVVITPMPGNPLCATAIAIGIREGNYFLRTAKVGAWPELLPAAACRIEGGEPTAFLRRVRESRTAGVTWRGEWNVPRAELAELSRENCEIRALLRFARAPYWVNAEDGFIFGDLRYDRHPDLDFADIATSRRPTRCPRNVPPWTRARDDVLNGVSR